MGKRVKFKKLKGNTTKLEIQSSLFIYHFAESRLSRPEHNSHHRRLWKAKPKR